MQIVCHLFLKNKISHLDNLIGDEPYRLKRVITYFNYLIGLSLQSKRGVNELEELMLGSDLKQLEKTATRYMNRLKCKDLSEQLAADDMANVDALRAINALKFHHFRWQRKGICVYTDSPNFHS